MFSPILPSSLPIPKPTHPSLSSLKTLTIPIATFPPSRSRFPSLLPIRMGGGPRTFPGGVSKWTWKRMQAKKAKQLLKARLLRERQIYEMRKRAELKAAVSELERPWEVVERAPTLFSVSADEQVKVLADRFQRAGGFDMWSERDGPEVFRSPVDGLPSARFFPKGVVHSVRPYGIIGDGEGKAEEEETFNDWIAMGGGGVRRRRSKKYNSNGGSDSNEMEARNSGERCDLGRGNGGLESEKLKFEGNEVVGKRILGEGRDGSDWIDVESRNLGEQKFEGKRISSKGRDDRVSCNGSGSSGHRGDGRKEFERLHVSDSEGNGRSLVRERVQLGLENSKVSRRVRHKSVRPNSSEGKKAGFPNGRLRNYGSDSEVGKHDQSNRQAKLEKVTLRPTTDLYIGEGSKQRGSNWSGGGGFRRNDRRSM